jgi:hypothetical protein
MGCVINAVQDFSSVQTHRSPVLRGTLHWYALLDFTFPTAPALLMLHVFLNVLLRLKMPLSGAMAANGDVVQDLRVTVLSIECG